MSDLARSCKISAFAWALALAAPANGTAHAGDDITYPVVFASLDDLAELGISYDPYPWDTQDKKAKPRFPNTCYDYSLESMGPSFISLSDDVIARHTSLGFTRESVCMGIVSGARFDPETGKRLPAIIFKNEAAFNAAIDALDIATMDVSFYVPGTFKSEAALSAGIAALKRGEQDQLNTGQIESLVGEGIYEEVPLMLPPCFKNATPYLDCTWRYGLHKGKKFSSSMTKRFRAFGRKLDARFRDDIKTGAKAENEYRASTYLTQDGLFGEDASLGLAYTEAPVTLF